MRLPLVRAGSMIDELPVFATVVVGMVGVTPAVVPVILVPVVVVVAADGGFEVRTPRVGVETMRSLANRGTSA